jgi:hypothetical protein
MNASTSTATNRNTVNVSLDVKITAASTMFVACSNVNHPKSADCERSADAAHRTGNLAAVR